MVEEGTVPGPHYAIHYVRGAKKCGGVTCRNVQISAPRLRIREGGNEIGHDHLTLARLYWTQMTYEDEIDHDCQICGHLLTNMMAQTDGLVIGSER